MKILISSYRFHPDVGGIETVSETLASEFAKRGHDVKLVTKTGAEGGKQFPFEVIRQPGAGELAALVKWCDLFLQNNISMTFAWPLIFTRRPWVVAHQTWIQRACGKKAWRDRIKRAVLQQARNVAVSRAIAADIGKRTEIVGNPYRDGIFRKIEGVKRERDIIFAGRLVSDKGVDVLLRAVGIMKGKGKTVTLTVAGEGPEKGKLQSLAGELGIGKQIDFPGERQPEELNRLFNGHKIMAIPSRWREPFGVTALEGIACGCAVVGTNTGGLPEAIGSCGKTVEPDNVVALCEAIEEFLSSPEKRDSCLRNAEKHLRQFNPKKIAGEYLKIFKESTG